MQFTPVHISTTSTPTTGTFFLFSEFDLILTADNQLPQEIAALGNNLDRVIQIGHLEGNACYVTEFSGEIPQGLTTEHLRTSYLHLGDDLFGLARYAFHLMHWDKTSRFCGKCGITNEIHPKENAKICTSCKHIAFPRISPAVIIAIVRDNKILLAQAKSFARPIYSTLAGFVEPGETLEECVHREVFEEVGIKVKNLKYFGSQPWPFPDSLMVAFTAEWDSGEISLNDGEMVDAGWYHKDNLPPYPDSRSIAKRLINWFTENH
ncbi:MAG: NAD(+) diphosphatase [candidate division Zixibacteria bacterium]|nr:NAD(+) diphosphatase [candidate division Zixibacteria bacterium]